MAVSLKERLGLGAASEPDDSEPEKLRSLTPVEREWKQRIYDRLLKVLDLSLLTSVEEAIAGTDSGDHRSLVPRGICPAEPRPATVPHAPHRRRSDGPWSARTPAGRSHGRRHSGERPAFRVRGAPGQVGTDRRALQ